MIIDASALLAIAPGEADAVVYTRAIAADPHPRIRSVTWFEASMRVEWAGDAVAVSRFEDVPAPFGAEIMPYAARHAELARRGRRLYGRWVHSAGRNVGDCVVYGVAKSESESLLCKGFDFARTDVEPALKD